MSSPFSREHSVKFSTFGITLENNMRLRIHEPENSGYIETQKATDILLFLVLERLVSIENKLSDLPAPE